jgi:hypothetical protein
MRSRDLYADRRDILRAQITTKLPRIGHKMTTKWSKLIRQEGLGCLFGIYLTSGRWEGIAAVGSMMAKDEDAQENPFRASKSAAATEKWRSARKDLIPQARRTDGSSAGRRSTKPLLNGAVHC